MFVEVKELDVEVEPKRAKQQRNLEALVGWETLTLTHATLSTGCQHHKTSLNP